jgi:hypothetical protein
VYIVGYQLEPDVKLVILFDKKLDIWPSEVPLKQTCFSQF